MSLRRACPHSDALLATVVLVVTAMLGALVGLGVAHAAKLSIDTPFLVQAAAPKKPVPAGSAGELIVQYRVFQKHFIYRDQSSVTVLEADGLEVGPAEFPAGKRKYDAISDREREIFETDFAVRLPVSVPRVHSAGKATVKLLIKWQGCNLPEGYCLFPAKKEVVLQVPVGSPSTVLAGGPPETAGGTKGPKLAPPPKPPKVDWSPLPKSAAFQEIDPEGQPHPVLARMLADSSSVVAGEYFRLGIHLQQQTNWHTYWKSPGDIGLPTEIEWSLPAGWEASDFEFPTPLRFDQEGIISYGYDGQVLFFSEVRVPEGQSPGLVELKASAKWLVCEVSCIPGSAELSLPIEVASPGTERTPSSFASLFDHYAAQHPVHPTEVKDLAIEAALSASAVRPEEGFKAAIRVSSLDGSKLQAVTEAGTWPAVAPITRFTGMLFDARVEPKDDGSFTVLLEGETFEVEELPQGEAFGALLQIPRGDGWVKTEVTVPVPWVEKGTQVVASRSTLFGGGAVEDAATAAGGETDASGGGGAAASASAAAVTATAAAAAIDTSAPEFLWMLFLAFLGGILLNVMPCVLPVLTMKLYSLVEQADVSAAERRTAGFAYSAGIVASFLALAVAVVVLRLAFGQDVLWGFQFQYPAYVAALATVVWIFGLSLFGVFEVPAVGANQAASASAKEGATGYFLTGVFATLLATPCSAPFLGTGMGFAFSLPTTGILLFFGVAGFGLAFPFLIVAVVPALFRFLPKPGAWMETFKHLMAFTLIATALWLVDVLMGQVGADGGMGFLAFLLFVSLGAWIQGRWGGMTETPARQLGVLCIAVLVAAGGGKVFLNLEMAASEGAGGSELTTDLDFSESMPWQPFSEERIDALAGTTVFVDFTADWCLTCKVNEKGVLASEAVRRGMADLGVIPLKADWTRKDETITKWLRRYGKAGVPFYLVIPGDRSRETLPLGEIITSDSVLTALKDASAN